MFNALSNNHQNSMASIVARPLNIYQTVKIKHK